MRDTTRDQAVMEYLADLPRARKAYAAHYAHHVQAGTVQQSAGGREWGITARARATIRTEIDRIAQAIEDQEVTAAENAIEDGQARWSETGSTRK